MGDIATGEVEFTDRTFFEDIKLLRPASILTYDVVTGNCDIQTYWSFGDIRYAPHISFEEAVKESGRLLRRAVQRQSSDRLRPGVYLSGGMDSRIILGLVERRPVASFTFGTRNSRDVVFAAQIARAMGSDHHWFEFENGQWVREYADLHLELTEGFHSWIHAHGISTLADARQHADVNLSGWNGGTVMAMSGSAKFRLFDAVDDDALLVRLYEGFNSHFTWPGVTEAEERLLYCEPMWRQVQGRAFESLREEFRRFQHERPDIRGEVMYIRQHCGRLTHNFVTFFRSHLEMRFPFFDYDLIDFIFSLPAQMRANYWLYRAVLQREAPRLAYIPWDDEEYLPTTRPLIHNAHKAWVKVRRRLSRLNGRLGRLLPQHATLYADYENYLRNELRPWAEGILYDPQTTGRGIFDPAFVRSLMARHLANRELWTIGKTAPLITYELMLRRFC